MGPAGGSGRHTAHGGDEFEGGWAAEDRLAPDDAPGWGSEPTGRADDWDRTEVWQPAGVLDGPAAVGPAVDDPAVDDPAAMTTYFGPSIAVTGPLLPEDEPSWSRRSLLESPTVAISGAGFDRPQASPDRYPVEERRDYLADPGPPGQGYDRGRYGGSGPADPLGPGHPVGRRPPGSRRSGWMRLFGWTGAFVGVLAVSVAGFGYYEYRKISNNIKRVDALATNDPSIRDKAKQLNAENFLLIGSDTRAGADGRYGGNTVAGARSDTTILAHLSPDRQRATLISFPRDAWVTIPPCRRANGEMTTEQKAAFNSAFELGGPQCTILTLQRLTGIEITHYVQVDFAGFKSMVDALGGVPVCSTQRVYDRDSGLRLSAGVQKLGGEQALAFVRARHNLGDGSDLDRIKRQQVFLASMVRVATSSGVLLNVPRLTKFLEAASKATTMDKQTSLSDLRTLATQLRGLDPKRVAFLTAPIANRAYDPSGTTVNGNRVLLDDVQGGVLWQSIIDDMPAAKPTAAAPGGAPSTSPARTVTVPPQQVSLRVLNGVGTAGLAGTVANSLSAQGFTITSTGNGDGGSGVTGSVVRYSPGQAAAALTVAAAVPGAILQQDSTLGTSVLLVIGDNYQGVKVVQVGQAVSVPKTAASGSSAAASTAGASPQPSTSADQNTCV